MAAGVVWKMMWAMRKSQKLLTTNANGNCLSSCLIGFRRNHWMPTVMIVHQSVGFLPAHSKGDHTNALRDDDALY